MPESVPVDVLEIHVRPHPGNDHGTPIPIVAGIGDKGELRRHVKAADYVQVVISLADLFAAVIQVAIPENESQASQGQVLPVLVADAAGFKGASDLVQFSAPGVAREFKAKRQGAIHLGIGERLMMALIPTGAHKDAEVGG